MKWLVWQCCCCFTMLGLCKLSRNPPQSLIPRDRVNHWPLKAVAVLDGTTYTYDSAYELAEKFGVTLEEVYHCLSNKKFAIWSTTCKLGVLTATCQQHSGCVGYFRVSHARKSCDELTRQGLAAQSLEEPDTIDGTVCKKLVHCEELKGLKWSKYISISPLK